ncbi:MAG: transposase [Desulfuromonadaceae bacterium]|nr:transposase [Desulfuromonadaceae bacterium]
MARPIRIEYEGAFYHVTSRGNERGKIFFTKADYRKFKEYLRDAQIKYGFILHGYVLMTNHYHLLIETPEKNLSKIMHYLNSSYTTYINIKRKRSGHLFQGRYKAILVDRDSYLLGLSRYLHLNPVRANMVERPEEYSHSSYAAYTGESDGLVRTVDLLSMLSKDSKTAKQKYKIFVESALGEKQESPMNKVYGGMILGSVPFIKEALNRLEDELLQRTETAHKKALRSPCETDDILLIVATHYGVTPEVAVSGQRNDIRKVVIYLLKKLSVASNQEIGAAIGGISGFAVAKTYQRYVAEMFKDGALREVVEKLMGHLSRVKG